MTVAAVLIVALLFIKLQYNIYLKKWNEGLLTTVDFSADLVEEGEVFDIVETCENRKKLEISPLRIKYRVANSIIVGDQRKNDTSVSDNVYFTDSFALGAYKRIIRRINCTSKKRGVYSIKEIYRSAYDLFLLHELNSKAQCNAYINVYPKRLNRGLTELKFNNLMGDILSDFRLYEDPYEFRGIREYLPGDNMHRVNWKASAKYDDFQVNEFNQTSQKAVLIAINFNPATAIHEDSLLEEELRLAVTFAEDLLEKGFEVSITGNALDYYNDEELEISNLTGINQLSLVHEAIARIDIDKATDEFLNSKRKAELADTEKFVIVISAEQSDELFDLLDTRITNNQEIRLVVPVNYRNVFMVPDSIKSISYEWSINEG